MDDFKGTLMTINQLIKELMRIQTKHGKKIRVAKEIEPGLCYRRIEKPEVIIARTTSGDKESVVIL